MSVSLWIVLACPAFCFGQAEACDSAHDEPASAAPERSCDEHPCFCLVSMPQNPTPRVGGSEDQVPYVAVASVPAGLLRLDQTSIFLPLLADPSELGIPPESTPLLI
ncbi:MAG TPA: hypothetical protein VLM89_16885 [Phycisphaerae bacterium]|nr:hypothetical protein [Phycisphaerae bacterium]